jgi:hypothetical protein
MDHVSRTDDVVRSPSSRGASIVDKAALSDLEEAQRSSGGRCAVAADLGKVVDDRTVVTVWPTGEVVSARTSSWVLPFGLVPSVPLEVHAVASFDGNRGRGGLRRFVASDIRRARVKRES